MLASIRLGYACINTRLPSPNRTCRVSNATPERLLQLASANLEALRVILEWNAAHDIRLFRISSDTIPLASHPVNRTRWWEALEPELKALGAFVRQEGMRVSMHPGQYTVLNSPRSEVVESSLAELVYHARFLDALGLGRQHKIVLHLGGVYGDPQTSLERFAAGFARLPGIVRQRLVLENDEKNYSLGDALGVAERLEVPVVFDVFHHSWKPSLTGRSLRELVELAGQTWQAYDGRQKIHYSDQWPGKPRGAHSQRVDIPAFLAFYDQVRDLSLDIMLEVKDKEASVLAAQAALDARWA